MHNFFLFLFSSSFSLSFRQTSSFCLFFMTWKGSWRKRLSWRRDRKMSRSLSLFSFLSLSLSLSCLFLSFPGTSHTFISLWSFWLSWVSREKIEREREACSNSGGMNMNMSCSLSRYRLITCFKEKRERERPEMVSEGGRKRIYPSIVSCCKKEREREREQEKERERERERARKGERERERKVEREREREKSWERKRERERVRGTRTVIWWLWRSESHLSFPPFTGYSTTKNVTLFVLSRSFKFFCCRFSSLR